MGVGHRSDESLMAVNSGLKCDVDYRLRTKQWQLLEKQIPYSLDRSRVLLGSAYSPFPRFLRAV